MLKLSRADAAGLVPPRPHGVEPDDEEPLAPVNRLRRFPLPLELAERPREARGGGVGDVVVPGDDEQRPPEASEEGRGALVLSPPAAMSEVAGDGDQLGLDALDQRPQTPLDPSLLHASRVQV